MNSNTIDIKMNILKAGVHLIETKLVTGTWGNISSRIPNSNFIAITPSGRNYLELTANDIVVVDELGQVVEGKLKPSSEMQVHLSIYKARKDVAAIVHTHSIFASACAVAGKCIPPIIEDLVQVVGGSVDIAEYALPGTSELARNVTIALNNKNAVLMANHGVVCCGQSLNESLLACNLVEKAAQIYIYANILGNVQILANDDVKTMHSFYTKEYRQN
jgi:L-fuculose-phosphate aldolase